MSRKKRGDRRRKVATQFDSDSESENSVNLNRDGGNTQQPNDGRYERIVGYVRTLRTDVIRAELARLGVDPAGRVETVQNKLAGHLFAKGFDLQCSLLAAPTEGRVSDAATNTTLPAYSPVVEGAVGGVNVGGLPIQNASQSNIASVASTMPQTSAAPAFSTAPLSSDALHARGTSTSYSAVPNNEIHDQNVATLAQFPTYDELLFWFTQSMPRVTQTHTSPSPNAHNVVYTSDIAPTHLSAPAQNRVHFATGTSTSVTNTGSIPFPPPSQPGTRNYGYTSSSPQGENAFFVPQNYNSAGPGNFRPPPFTSPEFPNCQGSYATNFSPIHGQEMGMGNFSRNQRYPVAICDHMRRLGLRFHGKRGAESFITRVEEAAAALRASDEEVLLSVAFFMHDVAHEWYTNNRDEFHSLAEFSSRFRQRFLGHQSDFVKIEEIIQRNQGSLETAADYITCVRGLIRRARLSWDEDTVIDCIYDHLLPRLQDRFTRESVHSLRELEEAATRAERKVLIGKNFAPPPHPDRVANPDLAYHEPREKRRHHPIAPVQSNSESSSETEGEEFGEGAFAARESAKRPPRSRPTNVVPTVRENRVAREKDISPERAAKPGNSQSCWACGGTDHFRDQCPKPREAASRRPKDLECFGCGRPGVVITRCPVCRPNQEMPGNEKREW